MPFGEIAPLFGAYAEGFWDRRLESMPGKYWAAFRFTDVADRRGDRHRAAGRAGVCATSRTPDRYPYLTCELGGA